MEAPTTEEAFRAIVDLLRKGNGKCSGISGYDLHVLTATGQTLIDRGAEPHEIGRCLTNEWSPSFIEAAWELCRMGVIRPGLFNKWHYEQHGNQADPMGFCMTTFGKKWLEEYENEDYIPIEPTAYGELIEKHGQTFGAGFIERAEEANKCYRAGAYSACAAMCGAAAESILLNLAIARDGDEEEVLKVYRSSKGRHRLYESLLGNQSSATRRQSDSLFYLLSDWRDESSHGVALKKTNAEAHTGLRLLIRYARFATENYTMLTRKNISSAPTGVTP